MSWFFKKNMNTERGKKPVWEDVTFLQPINYGVSIFLVILFSIILLFGCLFFIGIDHLISLFCLNIMFTYTGIMVNKPNGFSTVFTEALKVYKISLMVISTFIRALILEINCVANKECPPKSKKSELIVTIPVLCSTANSSPVLKLPL